MHEAESFTPQLTADGSFTFFSAEFGETFHSQHGARREAELKFVQPTILAHKIHQPQLRLLDICYGLGYNTAAALGMIWSINPNCQVELMALELDETVPKAAIAANLLKDWEPAIQQPLTALASDHHIQTNHLKAHLILGDARQTIQQVYQMGFRADAVFLDPFSPPHCPQLWTVEFLNWVTRCLKLEGRLATYSCAAAARIALMAAGLHIGSTYPVGRRSPGTVASLIEQALPPLSLQEQEHLLTRAAVPYRDPSLSDRAATILQRHQNEQQSSLLEPTSHWKKRWLRSEI